MAASGPSEADALGAWVRETLPRAVAYARSLLRDVAAAEDVAHDCYCRLLRHSAEYDLPRDGTKLLFRSITNACINRFQRARPVLSLDAPGGDGKSLGGAVVPGNDQGPQAGAELKELEQAIEVGMQKLSVMQRAALQLKALGHSNQEIADSLGLTPTNAGVLIYRARQILAVELAPYLGEKAG